MEANSLQNEAKAETRQIDFIIFSTSVRDLQYLPMFG